MQHAKTKIGDPFDFMMQEARAMHPATPLNAATKMLIRSAVFVAVILGGMSLFTGYVDTLFP